MDREDRRLKSEDVNNAKTPTYTYTHTYIHLHTYIHTCTLRVKELRYIKPIQVTRRKILTLGTFWGKATKRTCVRTVISVCTCYTMLRLYRYNNSNSEIVMKVMRL